MNSSTHKQGEGLLEVTVTFRFPSTLAATFAWLRRTVIYAIKRFLPNAEGINVNIEREPRHE